MIEVIAITVPSVKSPRKWWQRIFTPSRGDWWSLFGTGRGEDEDTKQEMRMVLEHLRGIVFISQRMETDITKLKNQITANLNKQPAQPTPLQEDQPKIQAIISKIDEQHCSCHTALENTIMTNRNLWQPDTMKNLDVILKRFIK